MHRQGILHLIEITEDLIPDEFVKGFELFKQIFYEIHGIEVGDRAMFLLNSYEVREDDVHLEFVYVGGEGRIFLSPALNFDISKRVLKAIFEDMEKAHNLPRKDNFILACSSYLRYVFLSVSKDKLAFSFIVLKRGYAP